MLLIKIIKKVVIIQYTVLYFIVILFIYKEKDYYLKTSVPDRQG